MKKIILIYILLVVTVKVNSQEHHTNIQLEFVDSSYNGYQDFAELSVMYLERVINSDIFSEKVDNLKMKKKQGKTNRQIYELILKGIEKQCPERVNLSNVSGSNCPKKEINREYKCPENKPYEINLKVRTINKCDGNKWLDKNCKLNSRTGTIGIDGNGDGIMAICPQRLEKWFENKRFDYLAGHYMHEYLHIIGFSHKGIGKRKSVVYKIGDLAKNLVINEIQKDIYKYYANEATGK